MSTPPQNKSVRVGSTALTTFICRILTNLDVPPEPAAIVAEVMVAANLRGVDSHGVALLNWYANILRDGSVAKYVSPTIEPDYEAMLRRIIGICSARSIPVAIHLNSVEAVTRWVDEGARFVLFMSDTQALAESFRRNLETIKSRVT